MTKVFGGFGLAILAYGVISLLVFGDILAPALLVTMFSNRLGAPFWSLLVWASAALAIVSASVLSGRFGMATHYRMPVFISLWMGLSIISVGTYAEWVRRQKVHEFSPDTYIQHSFFHSLREAPREFQFFLHAAALKDCKPYAWSYRQMAFYELPPDVAVNVLPPEWINRCAIKRRDR